MSNLGRSGEEWKIEVPLLPITGVSCSSITVALRILTELLGIMYTSATMLDLENIASGCFAPELVRESSCLDLCISTLIKTASGRYA